MCRGIRGFLVMIHDDANRRYIERGPYSREVAKEVKKEFYAYRVDIMNLETGEINE